MGIVPSYTDRGLLFMIKMSSIDLTGDVIVITDADDNLTFKRRRFHNKNNNIFPL